jgi:hypothetical protein
MVAIISKRGRYGLYTADFDTLFPHHHSLLVAFGNMGTAYVLFFFENKPTLDNIDFFDNRQDCRIAFYP